MKPRASHSSARTRSSGAPSTRMRPAVGSLPGIGERDTFQTDAIVEPRRRGLVDPLGHRGGVVPSSQASRRAPQGVDPDLPMAGVTTMEQLVQQRLSNDRFNALLFSAFAVVALVLAAIGIYGVMSFVVAQRRHEVGLRMALGLAGAYAVGRAMQGMWFSVGALDLFRFVAIAVTLIATALLACYVPARRAATVDPAVALRER